MSCSYILIAEGRMRVPGSKISPETDNPECGFPWFVFFVHRVVLRCTRFEFVFGGR